MGADPIVVSVAMLSAQALICPADAPAEQGWIHGFLVRKSEKITAPGSASKASAKRARGGHRR